MRVAEGMHDTAQIVLQKAVSTSTGLPAAVVQKLAITNLFAHHT